MIPTIVGDNEIMRRHIIIIIICCGNGGGSGGSVSTLSPHSPRFILLLVFLSSNGIVRQPTRPGWTQLRETSLSWCCLLLLVLPPLGPLWSEWEGVVVSPVIFIIISFAFFSSSLCYADQPPLLLDLFCLCLYPGQIWGSPCHNHQPTVWLRACP